MRLIATVTDKEEVNPFEFSYYLTSQGIQNTCEEVAENGKFVYRLWIYDEDHVEKALEYFKEYKAHPTDARYKAHSHFASQSPPPQFSKKNNLKLENEGNQTRRGPLTTAPFGPISLGILFAVVALFFFTHIKRPADTQAQITGVIQAPSLTKIEKNLIYDYPHYFEVRDELLNAYTAKDVEQKKPPSAEAQALVQQLKKTPVWMGIYELLLKYFKGDTTSLSQFNGPMFEKIRQGEIWRLFTPALLHLDFLHIFFNVLWFILLGNQIEFRLGRLRYLFLILLTGIVSNTAQYLVSGPFFMGLSGIVVGMATFIWARQQIAPWEGYLLHRFTFIFLAIFVVGMVLLQIVLFFIQLYGSLTMTVGLANTAHLTGALVGYLLGRSRFFALHPKHH